MDLTGGEQYEVYSKDIASGLVTQLTQNSDSSGSMAWAMDNITLFYITLVRISNPGVFTNTFAVQATA